MKPNPDRLYDLLPIVHRMRDVERGNPLRDFLRVLGTQADVLEADIARLYDNWFIETCEDWVVPYIGALLGYEMLPEAAALGEDGRPAVRLDRALAPRADVANTISSRRRKGTLSLLEDLARDASAWPARAVEFYRLLGWMQHLDHPHRRGGTASLREPGPLELIGGAFDPFARSVDVRRIESGRTRGRYAIPDVGLFVFRLRSFRVTTTPAYCVEERGAQNFTFSVLGNDTPLFQRPVAETDPAHIANEANLPVRLRRYRFALRGDDARYREVDPALYGDGNSVQLYAPDWPQKGAGNPVPAAAILPADLSDWSYRVPRNSVAVDPVLGRIVFPADQRPKRGVWVDYSYGFAAALGGGEYARATIELDGARRYYVHAALPSGAPDPAKLPAGHFASIEDALEAWTKAKDATVAAELAKQHDAGATDEEAKQRAAAARPRALVIELVESGVYEGRVALELEAGEAIQIRAADRTRPVLRLLDYQASRSDALTISGRSGSRAVLDGILVVGRGIEVQGAPADDTSLTRDDDLCEVVLRHCTLVPGWTLHCDCDPRRPGEPSLTLDGTRASVCIEHSIVGAISVISPAQHGSVSKLSLCDSILDATGSALVALGAPDEAVAGVDARFVRSTVFGEVEAHTISVAEDSIFAGRVRVLRRQAGCMRFCYVPDGSRTPRRFHCQPDAALADAFANTVPTQRAAARAATLLHVVPAFRSVRYGTPDYARLDDACCAQIRAGASDEASMGAFHDLYEPQREANLATRLDEHVPAGTDAAIVFAS